MGNGSKNIKSDNLFSNHKPLKIQLNYSNKQLNLNTNDLMFIQTKLIYFDKDKRKKLRCPLEPGEFQKKKLFSHPSNEDQKSLPKPFLMEIPL